MARFDKSKLTQILTYVESDQDFRAEIESFIDDYKENYKKTIGLLNLIADGTRDEIVEIMSSEKFNSLVKTSGISIKKNSDGAYATFSMLAVSNKHDITVKLANTNRGKRVVSSINSKDLSARIARALLKS